MKLINAEMIQGTVIDSEDPEKQGRIKCIIPGVFENSDEKELYPWISPIGMKGYQSFSKELNGAKVWVVQNPDNYNEFYYFPLFDKIGETKKYLDEKYDRNPEIVFLRDNCGTVAKLTYDEEDGTNIFVKESYVNIKPDGTILIHGKNNDVSLKNGCVYIGSDEAGGHEPAVYGNKLQDILGNLMKAMNKLKEDCLKDPHTVVLKPGFTQAAQSLQSYTKVICEKTFVN